MKAFYCAFLLAYSGSVLAVPDFLQKWKVLYPSSASGERGCQLCHAHASGGEPWNLYGFEIRNAYLEFFASTNVESAITFVEQSNSDNDPRNLSNLDEINSNLDPGWAPGPVNRWVYKNGDSIGGKAPPFRENEADEGLCVPVVVANGAVTLICL